MGDADLARYHGEPDLELGGLERREMDEVLGYIFCDRLPKMCSGFHVDREIASAKKHEMDIADSEALGNDLYKVLAVVAAFSDLNRASVRF